MATARDVDRALERWSEDLGSKQNVVGLGRVQAEGQPGQWCLAVYVEKKVPEADLKSEDRIPKTVTLEKQGKPAVEIETDVVEQGAVHFDQG